MASCRALISCREEGRRRHVGTGVGAATTTARLLWPLSQHWSDWNASVATYTIPTMSGESRCLLALVVAMACNSRPFERPLLHRLAPGG